MVRVGLGRGDHRDEELLAPRDWCDGGRSERAEHIDEAAAVLNKSSRLLRQNHIWTLAHRCGVHRLDQLDALVASIRHNQCVRDWA